jgi:hypothetical protein
MAVELFGTEAGCRLLIEAHADADGQIVLWEGRAQHRFQERVRWEIGGVAYGIGGVHRKALIRIGNGLDFDERIFEAWRRCDGTGLRRFIQGPRRSRRGVL